MDENGISRPDLGLAGLILAGGIGRRFGGPKAWATLSDGRTFLAACTGVLRSAGADPVLATLPPGSVAPGIDGLETLVLPEPGLDMFASLRLGIDALVCRPGWRRVAILPVDHPLVAPGTVSLLAQVSGRAVIPSVRGKHGHPVALDRDLAGAVASGDLPGPTLREVLREAGAFDVAVDDPGAVANCNTPAALATALAEIDALATR